MNPFENSPFSNELGFELVHWSAGKCVIALQVENRLKNRNGVAHGGVTASLLDAALGIAARSKTDDWIGQGTVTLNVDFLLPAQGRLLAEGRLLKIGGSLAFCDGEVRDESGTIVAKATAIYKIRPTNNGE